MILSTYDGIRQQLEVLVLRVCLNTNHGGPGQTPMPPATAPTPVNTLADLQHEQCMAMDGIQCRAARSDCDWCRFRDICAGKDRCPGGRRSVELPDPETLDACECTPSGPKWSSVSESHFCWMRETPCRANRDEVLIQQWADCGIDLDCPATSPFVKHPYFPPMVEGQLNLQTCFDMQGPKMCRASDACSWCPAFRGCAPRGQCTSLKTRNVVTTRPTLPKPEPTEMEDAYEYVFASEVPFDMSDCKRQGAFIVCTDGREFQVDANGVLSPVAAVAAPLSFRETLNVVMIKTLGVEVDPSSGQRCLSTENFCAMPGQEYCCQWQSDLVHFYRRLSQELGPSTDPRTRTRCTAIEGPCGITGQQYCCAWQTNLMGMFSL
jgi:hypothetical protein